MEYKLGNNNYWEIASRLRAKACVCKESLSEKMNISHLTNHPFLLCRIIPIHNIDCPFYFRQHSNNCQTTIEFSFILGQGVQHDKFEERNYSRELKTCNYDEHGTVKNETIIPCLQIICISSKESIRMSLFKSWCSHFISVSKN